MCQSKGNANFSRVSLLVIAGGKSSRMGEDKRWISLGGETLLARLLKRAARIPFAERFLCVARETPALRALAEAYGMRLLADERQEVGPMEGIRRGLSTMGTDYAFAVSCDMPFLDFSRLAALLDRAGGAARPGAVLPRTGRRWQTLAGLYHRDVADAFAAALARGAHKIRAVLETLPVEIVPFQTAGVNLFFNVNTPADLRLAAGRIRNESRAVPLVTVSAPQSNTGKTTFIERVLPLLAASGLRVGVVKGDAHGYHIDREGKDSYRFREAGASATAVVSPNGYFIEQKTAARESLAAVAARLQDVDLVLLESRNHGTAPILSLYRDKGEPILTDEVAAVFVKSEQALDFGTVATYDLDAVEKAAEVIRFLAGR